MPKAPFIHAEGSAEVKIPEVVQLKSSGPKSQRLDPPKKRGLDLCFSASGSIWDLQSPRS